MTASSLIEGTAPGSPAALLVLIVLVLAAFTVAGIVAWVIDRADRRLQMRAGRDVLRHANELGRVSDRTLERLQRGDDQ